MPFQKLKEYSLSKAPSVHTSTSEDEEDEDQVEEVKEKDWEGERLKVCIVFYKFQLIFQHTRFAQHF
jgi:hypothetical protein